MMKQMKKALALWIALALALPMFALAEDGAGDLAVEIVESAADIASAGVEGGDEVAAVSVEAGAIPGGDEADSTDLGMLLDDGDETQKPSPLGKVDQPEAGTDEVPGEEAIDTNEAIDEETSSVSPAGETASPTGEAFGDAGDEPQEPSPLGV